MDVTGVDLGFVGGSADDALQVNLANLVERISPASVPGLFNQMGSVNPGRTLQCRRARSVRSKSAFSTRPTTCLNPDRDSQPRGFLRGLQIGVVNLVEEGPHVLPDSLAF